MPVEATPALVICDWLYIVSSVRVASAYSVLTICPCCVWLAGIDGEFTRPGVEALLQRFEGKVHGESQGEVAYEFDWRP